jgi:hypothetical protein
MNTESLFNNKQECVRQNTLVDKPWLCHWLVLLAIAGHLITFSALSQQADIRSGCAIETQAHMLIAAIEKPGLPSDRTNYTEDARNALNILATSSDDLRVEFLKLLLSDSDTFDHARGPLLEIHRALIGLDPSGSRWQRLWDGAIYSKLTDELPSRFIIWIAGFAVLPPSYVSQTQALAISRKILDGIKKREINVDGYTYIRPLSSALRGLAAKLSPEAAADVAKSLLDPEIVKQAEDYEDQHILGPAVGALLAQLPAATAAVIAKPLVDIASRPATYQIHVLWYITALVPRLSTSDAADLAKPLVDSIAKPGTTRDNLGRHGQVDLDAIAALVARLSACDAEPLAKVLIDGLGNSDANLAALGQAIGALANRLTPEVAAELKEKALRPLVAHIAKSEMIGYSLEELKPAFYALVGGLSKDDAAKMTTPLVELMAKSETTEFRLEALEAAVSALATRLSKDDATKMTTPLVDRMKKSETTDIDLSELGQAVGALAAKLPVDPAADVGMTVTQLLINRMVKAKDHSFSRISLSFSALTPYLPSEFAAKIAGTLVDLMVSPSSYFDDISTVSAIKAVAKRLRADAAAELAKPLLNCMVDPETNGYYLVDLESAVDALAAIQSPEIAAELRKEAAREISERMANPKTGESLLRELSRVISSLAAELRPDATAEVANSLVHRIAEPETTTDLFPLCEAVIALAAQLPADATAGLAKPFIVRMTKPETTSYDLRALGPAVSAIAAGLPPKIASEFGLTLFEHAKNANAPELWVTTLTSLLAQFDSQWMQKAVDFLKIPTVVNESEEKLLALLEIKTGQNFEKNLDNFVQWVTKTPDGRTLKLDLNSAARFDQ